MRRASAFTVIVLMGASLHPSRGWAEELSPEGILRAMEAAEQSIRSFRSTFSVTYQQMVRHDHDEQGREKLVVFATDELPDPRLMEHEVLVAGDKFWRRDFDHEKNPVLVVRRAWDGSTLLAWDENYHAASKRSKVKYYWGARIHDPRDFAFQCDPEHSRLEDLRRCFTEGELLVAQDTLGELKVVRVEGEADWPVKPHTVGYRMWVDPARNHLPVRIETRIDGDLALRWYDIDHVKVSSGEWFPVKGTLDNFDFQLDDDKGEINTRIRMIVKPESIEISPPVRPDSFTLALPERVEVRDVEERLRLIREQQVLPEDTVKEAGAGGKK